MPLDWTKVLFKSFSPIGKRLVRYCCSGSYILLEASLNVTSDGENLVMATSSLSEISLFFGRMVSKIGMKWARKTLSTNLRIVERSDVGR